jgi:hypothetical protein
MKEQPLGESTRVSLAARESGTVSPRFRSLRPQTRSPALSRASQWPQVPGQTGRTAKIYAENSPHFTLFCWNETFVRQNRFKRAGHFARKFAPRLITLGAGYRLVVVRIGLPLRR